MKKVLMITGSLPPIKCGVGYYSAKLIHEFSGQKLDLQVLSTTGVNKDVNAPLHTVPNWRVTSLPKIIRAITKSQAQIIHIQYPAVGYKRQLGINLLPYALKLLMPRLKVVVTLHEYTQSRWIGKLRNRITIWPTKKVIVSNQPDKKALGKKALVIPIGANFDKANADKNFYQQVLLDNNLSASKPTLLFFGYPFPAKKLEVLLNALQEPQLQNYQLLIVGAGFKNETSYQKMLIKKVDGLNQTNPRAGVTGFMESKDVSKIMQECRYFIIPNAQPISAKSGTSIAALQNEMIVISSGGKDPQATVPYKHLQNCYLLSEATPISIAAAINELDSSADKRQQILRGAKELQKYFSWDSIVKQHIKLYEEL